MFPGNFKGTPVVLCSFMGSSEILHGITMGTKWEIVVKGADFTKIKTATVILMTDHKCEYSLQCTTMMHLKIHFSHRS